MRSVLVCVVLGSLLGCADGRVPEGAAGAAGASDIGVTQQAAQFADGTVINFVDVASATLSVTADFNPVTVNIYGVTDKTTDTGHQVGTVTLLKTLSLGADETKTYTVPFGNAAFTGGYGCLFLDANGYGPFDVFQTHILSGDQVWSVGGSVFTGGSYRMPFPKNTTKFVLAVTNQSDYAFDVQIAKLNTADYHTINLSPLSTYKFDSSQHGWTFSTTNPGSVQLFTTAGGVIALSGYYLVGASATKHRFYPVKAAPYF